MVKHELDAEWSFLRRNREALRTRLQVVPRYGCQHAMGIQFREALKPCGQWGICQKKRREVLVSYDLESPGFDRRLETTGGLPEVVEPRGRLETSTKGASLLDGEAEAVHPASTKRGRLRAQGAK